MTRKFAIFCPVLGKLHLHFDSNGHKKAPRPGVPGRGAKTKYEKTVTALVALVA